MKPQPRPGRYGKTHPTKPDGVIGPTEGCLGGGDYHIWEGPRAVAPLTKGALYVALRQCPYGLPGDLLWVRECHSLLESSLSGRAPAVWYWADGNPSEGDYTRPRPSIHMHRWASRITLRVTGLRIERVKAISEADAKSEGVEIDSLSPAARERFSKMKPWPECYRPMYALLWDDINGKGSWEANPWTWVVEFERVANESRAAA